MNDATATTAQRELNELIRERMRLFIGDDVDLVPGTGTDPTPARIALDRVGDRWTMLILGSLMDGPIRYSEIEHGLPGISQRMLTATLRSLERDGLITRTVYPEVPPHVEYALTAPGSELLVAVRDLYRWAYTHYPSIIEHREVFDLHEEERHH